MERDKIEIEEPILDRAQIGEEIRAPDRNFKPNPVHLSIMKEAKKNNRVYDRRTAIQKIKESANEEKLKNQMLIWNEVNLNTLVNAGYMTKQDHNIYIANPLAYDIQKSDFKPGKNHANLLLKNIDGVIRSLNLKQEHEGKNPAEKKRQNTFIDGMLKKLNDNGYIQRIEKGEYIIMDKGYEFLEEMQNNTPSKRDCKFATNRKDFAVTSFDRCIKDVVCEGKISEELILRHRRVNTIKKRIDTFRKNGLIKKDGTLTDECLKLLEKALELYKNDMLSIDKLTVEQVQLVKDMRIFLNLSKKQIVEHIYNNNHQLADMDLDFLIRKKIIKKDEDFGIYIMDKVGIALSNDLYPDAVKYHTKLHSRKEELEHDMLVYTAYHHWLKTIIPRGGKVIDIKNDRQLRKDDAKKYGHMVGSYPDLRVHYKIPRSDKPYIYDIEVDCGYDGKTIKSKVHGLLSNASNSNLGWYCKTLYQAAKVANILTRDTTRASRMNVARKMTVFYMDKDGQLQTVRHKHWDK